MKSYCAVIGAGIVGTSIVLRLAMRGVRVTWFCGNAGIRPSSASRAAGAMLCPFSELDPTETAQEKTATVAERLEARELYETFLSELEILPSKINWRDGIAVVASHRYVDRDWQQLQEQANLANQFGYSIEMLSGKDLSFLSDGGNDKVAGAVFLKREASLDVIALLSCLETAAKRHKNVLIHRTRVVAVSPDKKSSEIAIRTSSGRYLVPKVVLAAGASTYQLLDDQTLRSTALPPLYSGKGVSLRGRSSLDVPFAVRTPNRGYACGIHVVPNTHGVLYLGATNRLVTDQAFTSRPSIEELSGLLSSACSELSGKLAQFQVGSVHVGYRPVTVDHRPLVGATACPGIFVATATWRNGVLLAPLVAKLLTNELCDGKGYAERFWPLRKIVPADTSDRQLGVLAEDLLQHVVSDKQQFTPQKYAQMADDIRERLEEVIHPVMQRSSASSEMCERRRW